MKIKRILSMLLCLCMVLAAAPMAFAEDGSEEQMNIINEEELQGIITDYLSSKNIDPEKVSIGFCYTATGDEWFMNGDEWIYPASLYKVPLMMLLSEKVSSGELTQESNIGGLTVGQIEEYIIVYSNNDWAHTIRAYLGGDETWRREAMKYSELEEAAYDPDYLTYCYFSARYITDVIETLYAAPENYPNIIDCMGQAKPGEYLRTNLEGQFNVAQKYGSYIEPNGTWNNHAAGIIYTPNPVIVSIMTRNVDNYNAVIGNIAELLTNYALGLDNRLEIFEQQKLAAQVAAEQAAADAAAAEQRAAEEAEKAAAEKAAADRAAAEEAVKTAAKEAAKAKRQAALKKVVKLGLTALGIAILAAVGVAVINKRKDAPRAAKTYDKRGRREYGGERWDDEQWEDEPENIEKPAPVKVRPVRKEPEYRETASAEKEVVYSGAKPAREETSIRETVPVQEERAYRTATFSEEDFTDEPYEEEERDDDYAGEESVFAKLAGRLGKTGSSLKNSIGDLSRSVGQKKSAGGSAKKTLSAVPAKTKKRGKHEL